MPSISTFLRSLGNDGAITNARTVLDEREREDWLIAGLALRLDEWDEIPATERTRQATRAA
ncbi:MAG: hypothetical protein ACRDZU_07925 [Acidimicrobiales bacterium]